MLEQAPGYAVDKDVNISRYMGFTKFVGLILNKSLCFTNGKALSDKYELGSTDYEAQLLYKHLSQQHSAEGAARIVAETVTRLNEEKAKIYLSCWTEEKDESYAMWKVYLGGKEGVSIVSNYDSIEAAFRKATHTFRIGKVSYCNSINPEIELDTEKIVFKKKRFYTYENEIRIYYHRQHLFGADPGREIELNRANITEDEYYALTSKGFDVEIDIEALIKHIRISPFAGKHFELLVREFLKRTVPQLNDRVVVSKILDN